MERPNFDQLKQQYSQLDSKELLRLSEERESLTILAQHALRLEIIERGLEWEPHIPAPLQESTAKTKAGRFRWLWPVITNENEAQKAAKSGAYGAVFIAVCTCALSLIGIATKEPFLGMDGWGMVDAFLFAVIAWRMFRYSFPWAVFGLLLYSAEIFWKWKNDAPKGNLVVTVLIVLSLIAGVRGTAFLNKVRLV